MKRETILDGLKRAKRGLRFARTAKLARPLNPSHGSTPLPRAAPAADVRRLDAPDVRHLRENLPYESAAPLAERLERGDRCWGVFAQNPASGDTDTSVGAPSPGSVEAFVWVATDRWVYVEELGESVRVPPSTAYVYELYTFPEARGRGHAKTLLGTVLAEIEAEDSGPLRWAEAWVASGNEPSLRAFRALGFVPYASWRMVGAGRLRSLRGSAEILGGAPARPGDERPGGREGALRPRFEAGGSAGVLRARSRRFTAG